METQIALFQPPAINDRSQTQSSIKPTASNELDVYIDGAARGNPGPAGAGICIKYNNKPVLEKGFYLKEKTNNQAEYMGLICALILVEDIAQKMELKKPQLAIFSDSELLVKQMKHEYKIKNAMLAKLKKVADSLLRNYNHRFFHIVREKNKQADKLANLGIDKKIKIPATITQILSDYGLLI